MSQRLLLISDPTHWYPEEFYETLRERGVDVRLASGGYECLQAIRREPPDFLLLSGDPDFGFVDWVLHVIRPLATQRPVPMVCLVGYEPPETLSARWQLPVDNCLQRPLDEALFLERITGTPPLRTPLTAAVG